MDQAYINSLIEHPSESLSVEFKRWLDPLSAEGVAKIAKGVLGLRNREGGFFVVGIDNETGEPDILNEPSNVRMAFGVDTIQGIVSKYSHVLFEIELGFAERDSRLFPVIGVPGGARFPVACRRDLLDGTGKFLLREDAVYVRTLGANAQHLQCEGEGLV